jgi:hypothetical protein
VRRQELKKSVETYESQLNDLRKQVQAAEEASKTAKATVESTQKELERALPFEKEVKEKNLLIGKLRHEAVTLNEHLTKALRILKKGRPEDNVDKQIITNYFLHFLGLDRSDPKKFEALQLISALLGWTDGTFSLTLPQLLKVATNRYIQNNVSKPASPAQVPHLPPPTSAYPYHPSDAHLLRRHSTPCPTRCSWRVARATRSRWQSCGRTFWNEKLPRGRVGQGGAVEQVKRHQGVKRVRVDWELMISRYKKSRDNGHGWSVLYRRISLLA